MYIYTCISLSLSLYIYIYTSISLSLSIYIYILYAEAPTDWLGGMPPWHCEEQTQVCVHE